MSGNDINIIVFSKDRAMQLDLFLRSFFELVQGAGGYDINVLYTFSNESFRLGYEKLKYEHPEYCNLIREINFKKDVIRLVRPDNYYTVFFVDDNIFKESFDFFDNQMNVFYYDKDIICRSLRLNKYLTYCHPARLRITQLPEFDDCNAFEWRGQQADYGYPMSVDGHIFRTSDILPLVKDLDYCNPNTFEGELVKHPPKRRKMICYNDSIIINNPLNRVQTVNQNPCGDLTARDLNERFLAGWRISHTPFLGIKNNACHQEISLMYERNSN